MIVDDGWKRSSFMDGIVARGRCQSWRCAVA
jgi:hypothetical protein